MGEDLLGQGHATDSALDAVRRGSLRSLADLDDDVLRPLPQLHKDISESDEKGFAALSTEALDINIIHLVSTMGI